MCRLPQLERMPVFFRNGDTDDEEDSAATDDVATEEDDSKANDVTADAAS